MIEQSLPNTRAQASAVGFDKYLTGKPCKRGHTSERYTGSATCVECKKYSSAASYAADSAETNIRSLAWAAKNREKAREHMRVSKARKRATPMGSLNFRISRSMGRRLNGGKGGKSWLSFVPYTIEQLKCHIERQFLPRMTWDNRHLWHIDHIIPLASFKFTSPDDPDFRAAWALTNLRPLWAGQNQSKSAKRLVLI